MSASTSSSDMLSFREAMASCWEEMPPDVQAVFCDGEVRKIEKQNKANYILLAEVLVAVEDLKLWEHLRDAQGQPWRSFDAWLCDAAPISRSGGYSGMKVLRELKDDLPREKLLEIPKCNAEILRKIPRKRRREAEVIRAAATLTEESFNDFVEREIPEAHIEATSRMRFRPGKSARKVIDKGITVMCFLSGCDSREEALEQIVASWLLAGCEKEEYAGMSNEEAYESQRGEP